MTVVNDQSCGWINTLVQRSNIKSLNKDYRCDLLIIGAGFTGLSAARKFSQLNKNKKIIIIDAQIAGEGASSRNSGYLVDNTLNDGFISNKGSSSYKKKLKIYEEGIKAVKNFVREYQVNCDWNECGKYFASSKIVDEKKIREFSKTLSSLNFVNKILYHDEISKKLGTKFPHLNSKFLPFYQSLFLLKLKL